MSTRLLLDANISPLTATYLTDVFEFDVASVLILGIQQSDDLEIVRLAQRESRTIITHDLDFGEIFYRGQLGIFGVIMLKLEDQTIESVNAVLERFFRRHAAGIDLERSLVVIDERRMRVSTRG